jgi:hypothetical protein
MEKEQPKTLSDKIEETIEGVLRFGARFSRTAAVMLFRPLTCERTLLRAEHVEKRYVRPLSFLAIGGFVFSLTISVYPKGFLGLINIIWFGEEVGQTVLNRWQEAMSISGLLIAAFPVLFTVALGAHLAGLAIRSDLGRAEFFSLNCYLFGYQYFLLFSFFFFAILGSVVRELMGVEIREVLGIEKLEMSQRLSELVMVCLVGVFLSALVMPTVGLTRWVIRRFPSRDILAKLGRCLIVGAYCLLMLAVCSYTASAPTAFKHVATPKAETIKIHFLKDPDVVVREEQSGKPHARFDLSIAIENVPTAHLIARREDVTVGIVVETKGQKDSLWASDDFMISAGGRDEQMMLVEKGRVGAYRLAGTVRLTPEFVSLVRERIEKPYETNDFNFFVNIRVSLNGRVTDRRLYISPDNMIATRRP